jgi:hypothetical protein
LARVNQNNPGGFVNAAAMVYLGAAALSSVATAAIAADSLLAATGNAILLGTQADGYVTLGGIVGAKTFNIPDAVWQSMGAAEKWIANQAFLDAAIKKGSTIILGSSAADAVEGTFFWREIDYLKQMGYQVSADGTQMIVGGGH